MGPKMIVGQTCPDEACCGYWVEQLDALTSGLAVIQAQSREAPLIGREGGHFFK